MNIKCVVIGEERVGKTSLINYCLGEEFDDAYVPTALDQSLWTTTVEDVDVDMEIWDLSGSSLYDAMRPLSYDEAHVFIIVFSLDHKESLDKIRLKWVPEIRSTSQHVPFIVVGNKLDLRESSKSSETDEEFVTTEQGSESADFLCASRYFETSSKSRKGIRANDIFQEASKIGLEYLKLSQLKLETQNEDVLSGLGGIFGSRGGELFGGEARVDNFSMAEHVEGLKSQVVANFTRVLQGSEDDVKDVLVTRLQDKLGIILEKFGFDSENDEKVDVQKLRIIKEQMTEAMGEVLENVSGLHEDILNTAKKQVKGAIRNIKGRFAGFLQRVATDLLETIEEEDKSKD